MDFIFRTVQSAAGQVLVSLSHNWPFLAASIIIAAAIKVFVDTEKIARQLTRFRGLGVFAATAAAVATPFCSCGTTAVVLGMMASTMPWAPIVAFMVASPLSSPEGLVYSAGLFGWPFAIAYFAASIALGIAGGFIAAFLEKKGWLRNQARYVGTEADIRSDVPAISVDSQATASMEIRTIARISPAKARATLQLAPAAAPACGCSAQVPAPEAAGSSCGCGGVDRLARSPVEAADNCGPSLSSPIASKALAFGREAWEAAKKLLPLFVGFAFIGYLINGLIPSTWIPALFGSGHPYSVPLAATIGLPLYINSEASLPLVRALMDSGMSQGAIMAFLIAGSGTSMGAIAGALTIARWKVVCLVVAVLWLGAMLAGFGFDFLVAAALA